MSKEDIDALFQENDQPTEESEEEYMFIGLNSKEIFAKKSKGR